MKLFDRERSDWAIVLIILLLGFLFVIVAGQWALRFSPGWTLDTDMESHLDPNRDFLTGKPKEFIEPVDPAILTQPVWINVMFTPGVSASFATRTPIPESTDALPTQPGMTPVATNTIAVTNTTAPTSTFVWLPLPATSTRKPKEPTATNTPIPSGDLVITVDDGAPAYSAPGTLTYFVNISNPSAFAVNGIIVTDFFSAQIESLTWSCIAICVSSGTVDINDILNLPAASVATYRIDVNISQYAVGTLLNTASITIPAGFIDTDPGNNSATDSDAGPGGGGGQVTIGSGDGASPFLNLGVGNPAAITMILGRPIVGDGTGNYDFVFYERFSDPPANTQIQLDQITIRISPDGSPGSWTTVFNWGDLNASNNGSISGYCLAPEDDNCVIPSTDPPLYNGAGIPIDIDSFGLTGSYHWIELTAPDPSPGDGADIDAIQPYYP